MTRIVIDIEEYGDKLATKEAVAAVGCYVAKNRRGKLGTAHFTFEGEKMLFTELSYRRDEPPDTPRGSRRGGFAG